MNIGLGVAFVAGLISFFAPCVVPLLPAYVGYVTGVSLQELKKRGYKEYRKKMLLSSALYILGFSLVFTLLGTAAAGFGSIFRGNGRIIQIIGGMVILVLGLEFAGLIHIGSLARERRLGIPKWVEKLGYARAFFIGLVFAVTWTPCVGAVLGSVLALAAVSGTASTGALLLFVYSLGISVPFLLVSLSLASAPKYLKSINKHIGVISKISGLILAALGLLLITGWYANLNSWMFEIAYRLGWQIR